MKKVQSFFKMLWGSPFVYFGMTIFILHLIVLLPVSISYALRIENVQVVSDDSSTAVSWSTDVLSNSSVRYAEAAGVTGISGTAGSVSGVPFSPSSSSSGVPSLDLHVESETPQILHRLSLATLKPKTYAFAIHSCTSSECARTDPSFFVAGSDTIPPDLNITTAPFSRSGVMDIAVRTEPNALVRLFVNGQASRVAERRETRTGDVVFVGVIIPTSPSTLRFVAEDFAGNKNEKSIVITIDDAPPVISGLSLPNVTTVNSVTLTGRVSERVSIDIFVVGAGDATEPDRMSVPDVKSISSQFVTFAWNQSVDSDVGEYGLYRDEVLVGVVVATSLPAFTDNSVGSGKTYRYRLQAVDKACNMGSLSDSIEVRIPSGTKVELPVSVVDFSCKKSKYHVDTDGTFAQTLSLEQGANLVRVIVTDLAGNSARLSHTVVVDTIPPVFKELNLDGVSPTYTKEITIRGKVSEKVTVFGYVNDMQVPKDLVVTEDDGSFELTLELSRINRKGDSSETRSLQIGDAEDIGFDNQVKIIAIDIAGQKVEQGPKLVTLAECGFGNYFTLELGKPAPSILNPRRILEGFGTVGFPFTLHYNDLGTVEGLQVTVHKMPISPNEEAKYDMNFEAAGADARMDSKKRNGFFELIVDTPAEAKEKTKFAQEDAVSNHRKGECLIPGLGCYKFPVYVEIRFNQVLDRTPNEARVTGINSPRVQPRVQKVCFRRVEVGIDKRINPKVLPNGFLKTTIKFFDEGIKLIDTVLKPIQSIFNVVFYTCLLGFYVAFFQDFTEKSSCEGAAALGSVTGTGGFDLTAAKSGVCDVFYPPDKTDSQDSNKKCVACQEKLNERRHTFNKLKWFCDRIFCPSAPSLQRWIKESQQVGVVELKIPETSKDMQALPKRIFVGSDCAAKSIDYAQFRSSEGRVGIAQVWSDFQARKLDKPSGNKGVTVEQLANAGFNSGSGTGAVSQGSGSSVLGVSGSSSGSAGPSSVPPIGSRVNCANQHPYSPECCGFEYNEQWSTVCSLTSPNYELKESYCLSASRNGERPPECGAGSAITSQISGFCSSVNGTGGEFFKTSLVYGELTSSDGSSLDDLYSAEEAVDESRGASEAATDVNVRDSHVLFRSPEERQNFGNMFSYDTLNGGTDPMKGKLSKYVTDHSVYIYITPPDASGQLKVFRGYKMEAATLANLPNLIRSDDEKIPVQQNLYFIPDGVHLEKFFSDKNAAPRPYAVIEREWISTLCSGSELESETKLPIQPCSRRNAEAVYDRIKKFLGTADKDYIVNPADDIASSFKCACLPGITTHLKKWRGIFTAVKNCFNAILITGDGSAGACNAVLSRYVCDTIYMLLKCYVKRYDFGVDRSTNPLGGGGMFFGLGNVGSQMTQAGTSVQQSLSNRYGQTSLYQQAFSEQKLVNTMCLYAFTGTWNLNARALAEGEIGSIPVDSQPFLYPCTKRFVRFDPASDPPGLVTWDYQVGTDLFAGADLTYTLNLKCSSGYNCEMRDGFKDGECDCNKVGEKVKPVLSGTLRQFENIGAKGEVFQALQSEYRFDRAVLEWQYRDKDNQIKKDSKDCALETLGGDPPVFCALDILSNTFRCGGDFFAEYFAKFSSDVVPNYPDPFIAVYRLNDPVTFSIPIVQRIPEVAGCKTSVCEHTKFLTYTIKNAQGAVVQSNDIKGFNAPGSLTLSDEESSRITAPLSTQVLRTNGEKMYTIGLDRPLAPEFFNLGGLRGSFNMLFDREDARSKVSIQVDPASNDRLTENIIVSIKDSASSCQFFKAGEVLRTNDKISFTRLEPIDTCVLEGDGTTRTIRYRGLLLRVRTDLQGDVDVYISGTGETGIRSRCSLNPSEFKNTQETWTASFEIHDAEQSNSGGIAIYEPSASLSVVDGKSQRFDVPFKVICNTEYKGNQDRLANECGENKPYTTARCYCYENREDTARAIERRDTLNCGGALSTAKGVYCIDGSCRKIAHYDEPKIVCKPNAVVTELENDCICGVDGDSPNRCAKGQYCKIQPYGELNECLTDKPGSIDTAPTVSGRSKLAALPTCNAAIVFDGLNENTVLSTTFGSPDDTLARGTLSYTGDSPSGYRRFVALPWNFKTAGDALSGLDPVIPRKPETFKVVAVKSGSTCFFGYVLDVGPWFIDDDYWVLSDKPYAEKNKGQFRNSKNMVDGVSSVRPSGSTLPAINGAGIDLSPDLWLDLGKPTRVVWKFVDNPNKAVGPSIVI